MFFLNLKHNDSSHYVVMTNIRAKLINFTTNGDCFRRKREFFFLNVCNIVCVSVCVTLFLYMLILRLNLINKFNLIFKKKELRIFLSLT
jgi:ABC-type tungstate transport system substrate-binding protein